jgi:uncharacterized membrane protein YphA (DoxX/SURF4 family)
VIDLASAPYAALLLRLCLGIMFLAHALFNGAFKIRPTKAFFLSIGLPGWFVYAIVTVELVGGACLILGIIPRYVALLLIPEILGTIVMVRRSLGARSVAGPVQFLNSAARIPRLTRTPVAVGPCCPATNYCLAPTSERTTYAGLCYLIR